MASWFPQEYLAKSKVISRYWQIIETNKLMNTIFKTHYQSQVVQINPGLETWTWYLLWGIDDTHFCSVPCILHIARSLCTPWENPITLTSSRRRRHDVQKWLSPFTFLQTKWDWQEWKQFCMTITQTKPHWLWQCYVFFSQTKSSGSLFHPIDHIISRFERKKAPC